MTRVTAPSRLHFGLLSLPNEQRPPTFDGEPTTIRAFGGVGLMVDQPGLTVHAVRANEWEAEGPLAGRALIFAQTFVATLPEAGQSPFRVVVEQSPPEHTGLGVGTQLGLSVAKAIACESGHAHWPATMLARRVGRGERSAIGVHGFDHGGLIIEGGKGEAEAISPLVAHLKLPDSWRVLLFQPDTGSSWHGHRERQAFARLSRLGPTPADTDTLCRLLLMGLMPAVSTENLELFSAALYEFNARVGDIFAPAQGGRYGSPAIADVIRRLRAAGIQGVGQSSWGPTVFAIVHQTDAVRVQSLFADVPNLLTTVAANGASCWTASLS